MIKRIETVLQLRFEIFFVSIQRQNDIILKTGIRREVFCYSAYRKQFIRNLGNGNRFAYRVLVAKIFFRRPLAKHYLVRLGEGRARASYLQRKVENLKEIRFYHTHMFSVFLKSLV